MKYNIEIIRLLAVILITFTHTRNDLDEGIFNYIINELPKFGTLILSIISGYLYWEISKDKNNLFLSKVKSLFIPYLIANLIVIIPVLILHYYFNFNVLNRLSFDHSIITEGIFSLTSPPINPPTYFIRDIFIVFVIVELIKNKNIKMLLILIPIAFFGKLLLRVDIMLLFTLGILTAHYKDKIKKFRLITALLVISTISFFYFPDYIKYPIVYLLFVTLIDIKIRFPKTGGYTYLLHLYHSPIMVISFPLLSMFITNPYINVITQILLAIVLVYVLYFTTRKIKPLQIISGGR